MNTNVHEVKGMLSKLMATENVIVRHSHTAHTASFDVKDRVLTLPAWDNISDQLYDLLCGHETSHAIDSPRDWVDHGRSLAKKYFPGKEDSMLRSIMSYLNVVEDVRVDKRQLRRFPGLKKDYFAGYKELHDRGFFDLGGRDIATLPFIDRMNIYYKGGVAMNIPFSKEEKEFVDRAAQTETFEDVKQLVSEIIASATSDVKEQPQGQGKKKVKVKPEKGEGQGMGQGSSEEDEDDGDSSEDDNDSGDDDGDKEGKPSDKGDSGDKSLPESITDKALEESLKSLVKTGNGRSFKYLKVSYKNLETAVVDYKKVMKTWNNFEQTKFNSDFLGKENYEKVLANATSFKTAMLVENRKTIGVLVKEFEMRKAADEYSKALIAKTGVINTNRLHSYSFNDDIFRRSTVLPKGKNHGMMMFIDFSGSMVGTKISDTLKQLIILGQFCRRVQIPFEVYSFEDGNNQGIWSSGTNNNEINLSRMSLKNILSSRMSTNEFSKALEVLMNIANTTFQSYVGYYDHRFGGTPLNEAILFSTKLVPDFIEKTKVQEMTTIFLSDGESNSMSLPADGWSDHEYFIEKDHKTFSIDRSFITRDLISFLKKTVRTNVVGFYMSGNNGTRVEDVLSVVSDGSYKKTYSKDLMVLKENGSANFRGTCYDKYFIVNNGTKKSGASLMDDLLADTSNINAKRLRKLAVTKGHSSKILREFIDTVTHYNRPETKTL